MEQLKTLNFKELEAIDFNQERAAEQLSKMKQAYDAAQSKDRVQRKIAEMLAKKGRIPVKKTPERCSQCTWIYDRNIAMVKGIEFAADYNARSTNPNEIFLGGVFGNNHVSNMRNDSVQALLVNRGAFELLSSTEIQQIETLSSLDDEKYVDVIVLRHIASGNYVVLLGVLHVSNIMPKRVFEILGMLRAPFTLLEMDRYRWENVPFAVNKRYPPKKFSPLLRQVTVDFAACEETRNLCSECMQHIHALNSLSKSTLDGIWIDSLTAVEIEKVLIEKAKAAGKPLLWDKIHELIPGSNFPSQMNETCFRAGFYVRRMTEFRAFKKQYAMKSNQMKGGNNGVFAL